MHAYVNLNVNVYAHVNAFVCVNVHVACVYTLLTQGMVVYTFSYMQGFRFPTSANNPGTANWNCCWIVIGQGLSGGLGPTQTFPVCRANVPASDAPGRGAVVAAGGHTHKPMYIYIYI